MGHSGPMGFSRAWASPFKFHMGCTWGKPTFGPVCWQNDHAHCSPWKFQLGFDQSRWACLAKSNTGQFQYGPNLIQAPGRAAIWKTARGHNKRPTVHLTMGMLDLNRLVGNRNSYCGPCQKKKKKKDINQKSLKNNGVKNNFHQ